MPDPSESQGVAWHVVHRAHADRLPVEVHEGFGGAPWKGDVVEITDDEFVVEGRRSRVTFEFAAQPRVEIAPPSPLVGADEEAAPGFDDSDCTGRSYR